MAQLREPLRTRGDEIMNKEYRQVIHFAATSGGDTSGDMLYAVLDDGTVYSRYNISNEPWIEIVAIPETEAAVRDEEI